MTWCMYVAFCSEFTSLQHSTNAPDVKEPKSNRLSEHDRVLFCTALQIQYNKNSLKTASKKRKLAVAAFVQTLP